MNFKVTNALTRMHENKLSFSTRTLANISKTKNNPFEKKKVFTSFHTSYKHEVFHMCSRWIIYTAYYYVPTWRRVVLWCRLTWGFFILKHVTIEYEFVAFAVLRSHHLLLLDRSTLCLKDSKFSCSQRRGSFSSVEPPQYVTISIIWIQVCNILRMRTKYNPTNFLVHQYHARPLILTIMINAVYATFFKCNIGLRFPITIAFQSEGWREADKSWILNI